MERWPSLILQVWSVQLSSKQMTGADVWAIGIAVSIERMESSRTRICAPLAGDVRVWLAYISVFKRASYLILYLVSKFCSEINWLIIKPDKCTASYIDLLPPAEPNMTQPLNTAPLQPDPPPSNPTNRLSFPPPSQESQLSIHPLLLLLPPPSRLLLVKEVEEEQSSWTAFYSDREGEIWESEYGVILLGERGGCGLCMILDYRRSRVREQG